MILAIIALILLSACSTASGDRSLSEPALSRDKVLFRFVFMGDSRGDYKASPPSYLEEGPFKKIVDQITAMDPKPDFVIFNGDMVAKTTYEKAPEFIERWQRLFLLPMRNKGIAVYCAPGNHDIDGNALNQDKSIRYIPLFRTYYQADNPLNGPPGYEGVSYSFTHKNCHFVTVTSQITHEGADNKELEPSEFVQKDNDFEYYVNKDNLKWLNEDLKKDHSTFSIFFTHSPLYAVGPHHEDKKTLEAHPSNVAKLAATLNSNHVDAYLASHEHVYARINLGPDNPKSSVVKSLLPQITLGSVSAPLSRKPPRKDAVIEKYFVGYGFMVADVKKDEILVRVLDENGQLVDSFSISKTK